jgi:hypothetical protein
MLAGPGFQAPRNGYTTRMQERTDVQLCETANDAEEDDR